MNIDPFAALALILFLTILGLIGLSVVRRLRGTRAPHERMPLRLFTDLPFLAPFLAALCALTGDAIGSGARRIGGIVGFVPLAVGLAAGAVAAVAGDHWGLPTRARAMAGFGILWVLAGAALYWLVVGFAFFGPSC